MSKKQKPEGFHYTSINDLARRITEKYNADAEIEHARERRKVGKTELSAGDKAKRTYFSQATAETNLRRMINSSCIADVHLEEIHAWVEANKPHALRVLSRVKDSPGKTRAEMQAKRTAATVKGMIALDAPLPKNASRLLFLACLLGTPEYEPDSYDSAPPESGRAVERAKRNDAVRLATYLARRDEIDEAIKVLRSEFGDSEERARAQALALRAE